MLKYLLSGPLQKNFANPCSRWPFFLHSFHKYPLNIYYVLGTVLSIVGTMMSRRQAWFLPWKSLDSIVGEKRSRVSIYNAWNFPWIKSYRWTSLVVQWLRIRLPMQGTRVQALVWEDPTCRRATKPMRHNYWACALEPMSHNNWACMPQLLKPSCLEPVLRNKRSHHNEKPVHRNEEQPPLAATRESPHTAMKTQRSQK